MSIGWSVFVIGLVLANVAGCAWLLLGNRHVEVDPTEKGESTGHDFDGIEELNNPLPAWWTWLFVGTLVFAAVYLVLYPGLGSFDGVLGWTSAGQHAEEERRAEERFGPLFESFLAREIPELAGDERAVSMGRRIFANRCATCHGADARGGAGYPNLTDDDWLHGGTPEAIESTIRNGRNGMMPPLAAAIGGSEGAERMAEYVVSLSGREHDAVAAAAAKPLFDAICTACHGADARGMQPLGAPNLTDDVWLHGGRRRDIVRVLEEGVVNQMPAHGDILDPAHVRLVATYVYALSHDVPSEGDEVAARHGSP